MVKINKEECIGCGACVSTCGEVFEMGDDGKAKVKAQKDIPEGQNITDRMMAVL